MKKQAGRINKKVIIYSLIGIGFLALAFLIDWLFLIGTLIAVYLNQRELIKTDK